MSFSCRWSTRSVFFATVRLSEATEDTPLDRRWSARSAGNGGWRSASVSSSSVDATSSTVRNTPAPGRSSDTRVFLARSAALSASGLHSALFSTRFPDRRRVLSRGNAQTPSTRVNAFDSRFNSSTASNSAAEPVVKTSPISRMRAALRSSTLTLLKKRRPIFSSKCSRVSRPAYLLFAAERSDASTPTPSSTLTRRR